MILIISITIVSPRKKNRERERAPFIYLFLMMRKNKYEEKMRMIRYGQWSTLSCVGLRLPCVFTVWVCYWIKDLSKSK